MNWEDPLAAATSQSEASVRSPPCNNLCKACLCSLIMHQSAVWLPVPVTAWPTGYIKKNPLYYNYNALNRLCSVVSSLNVPALDFMDSMRSTYSSPSFFPSYHLRIPYVFRLNNNWFSIQPDWHACCFSSGLDLSSGHRDIPGACVKYML